MKNKTKAKVLMGAFSLTTLLLPKEVKGEETFLGETISNYQSFLTSSAKDYLEDYLRIDSENSFMEINQDGITTDEVNFRMGPGTTYGVIRTLDSEESIEVLGRCDNDWYLAKVGNTLGFIYGDYVRTLSKEFIDSQRLEYRQTFLCAVEAVSGVNVRESNDLNGKIIGGLNPQDKMPAYEKMDNGWYHIDYNGQDGYVFGELVKEIYATSSLDYPMIYIREEAPFCEEPYNEAISILEKDQFKYIYGENQDYYFIENEGRFGYVMKSHCERLTDTYVVVDISDQILKIYNRGEEIFSSYVVTGKDTTPTYTGAFYLRSKDRNVILRGIDYATPVDYWMPFDGGRGLHDASWREYFGGDIYEDVVKSQKYAEWHTPLR